MSGGKTVTDIGVIIGL